MTVELGAVSHSKRAGVFDGSRRPPGDGLIDSRNLCCVAITLSAPYPAVTGYLAQQYAACFARFVFATPVESRLSIEPDQGRDGVRPSI